MCTELELPETETEETFEDFKRIILDGVLNCEDEGHAQD